MGIVSSVAPDYIVIRTITATPLCHVHRSGYVIAHFSRHIRAGMTIISAGDAAGHTAAAYDAASSLLVLVSAPPGAGSQTYDLSAFGTVTGPITRWVTETGGGDMYRRYDDITLVGKTFTAPFAARDTVQTFEIRGVNM